ncbi:type I restriction enzyme R subunit [Hydrogenoanaerobacterium saccharovorans]|uniref:Type I restriction enzyme endonuclease subunit n=1 Tax=Hydrogenoanaerobacterium saccharovorans TaxID=474960 RepID=A0A1H8ANF3_9FIRM|nr:HsdR family type I site-specific deoxyribonuclease [Hydrogenoanaerobacterium saccharovorans]RPF47838.1 type I restriction enzyme R subunit [Hydrogenoanaerobacterium saccharovorans]SEM72270.1 type I restriction enzyme, R subunit [Hydrogenoanaerobacterium saccharovorans]
MTFDNEAGFEAALINLLTEKYGWEPEILRYKTEEDLIQNWKQILFENNREVDRLNDVSLTDGEMQQVLEQVTRLRTPLKLNGFINGKTVAIKRDNPEDELHFGKEVSLKIYDSREIAAGQSRYQIAQQPVFKAKSSILQNRRGDFVLLINGMPLIHCELKRSGVDVSQACNQIEKYAHEGVFTGLFALVQIFIAMQPDETVYFSNPGPDGRFNKDFYFHWADANNEPLNHWKDIAQYLLSIPMAHQLIGFYTVADDTDGVLKVMRSYQYFAASRITSRVAMRHWADKDQLGGYIWHTTGSGKTLTSFKSAQLIADSKDADKVVFLMDRVELGTQSLMDYRGFADDADSVQATENTDILVGKLKSDNPANTLIVTSIQKMSRVEEDNGFNAHDISIIQDKRIVFIIDEAHRDVFGDMLRTIKNTFPNAMFFGFTGTPIHDENQKKMSTTSDIFGNELHRYSIADGIRDKNVLGFDPYMVPTYKDRDLRKAVALEKAKATTEEEALSDEKKKKIYLHYMNHTCVPMAGYIQADGNYLKGIEDYLPSSQYEREEHQCAVVDDILDNWITLSHNSRFHAIFATSSIPEAIQYYKIFKSKSALKVTALFDPTIDNNGSAIFKEDAIIEIIEDYNTHYGMKFQMSTYSLFKKDISYRLAHKEQYKAIEHSTEQQIELLIVVDQMLTGFDSKWINTLYLDKVQIYEKLIQAFSRTNRLYGPEKPFGTIRYYRKPYTMQRNIDEAFKLYSGDKPLGLFADKLEQNLNKMNELFDEINAIFRSAGIANFQKLPADHSERGQFAKLFKQFNNFLEAAKIQGFDWEKLSYDIKTDSGKITINLHLDETTYLILVLRYKELFSGGGGGLSGDVPYEIDSYLTEINTGVIDANYMNSRFKKYLKALQDGTETIAVLDELHKSFATLNQEEQKYANIFLHDVQSGDVQIDEGKTLRDYITEYMTRAKNDQIHIFAVAIGVDESALRNFMQLKVTESSINEFGRFDKLKATINRSMAKDFLERTEGKGIKPFQLNMKIDQILRKFIFEGGFDIA